MNDTFCIVLGLVLVGWILYAVYLSRLLDRKEH